MSEVSLPRPLGYRQAGTSINDLPYLPLGNTPYSVVDERILVKSPDRNELTVNNNFIVGVSQVVKNSVIAMTVKYFSGSKIYTNESFIDTDIIVVSYTYNKTAAITPNLNDDDTSIQQKSVTISDAYARNLNYDEQQLTLNKRSLIGKVSNQMTTSLYDLQRMAEFNRKNDKRMDDDEYRDYKESQYNLVASPFTTAEKFIIP